MEDDFFSKRLGYWVRPNKLDYEGKDVAPGRWVGSPFEPSYFKKSYNSLGYACRFWCTAQSWESRGATGTTGEQWPSGEAGEGMRREEASEVVGARERMGKTLPRESQEEGREAQGQLVAL